MAWAHALTGARLVSRNRAFVLRTKGNEDPPGEAEQRMPLAVTVKTHISGLERWPEWLRVLLDTLTEDLGSNPSPYMGANNCL